MNRGTELPDRQGRDFFIGTGSDALAGGDYSGSDETD
jgi:hypothetical protein